VNGVESVVSSNGTETGRGRFPWWVLNPGNAAPVSFRLAKIAERFLNQSRVPRFAPRAVDERFAYATIVRQADLTMSRVSLQSVNRRSATAPKLFVGCDESLPVPQARDFYSSWPGGVQAVNAKEVADWHRRNGDERMAQFCEAHIFGFKHALCLMALETEAKPVLYCDSDVLWFRDPAALVAGHGSKSVFGTVDCGYSYNHRLLEAFPRHKEKLSRPHGINAGFALYNARPKYGAEENEFLDAVLQEDPVHFFSEQTFFALLVKNQGGLIDAGDVVTSEKNTVLPSWIGKKWYARHYVSPVRHQLWTDAMFL